MSEKAFPVTSKHVPLTRELLEAGDVTPSRRIEKEHHPGSRDWYMGTVPCLRRDCVANHGSKCVMPSCISIGADGKCKGYHKRSTA